MDQLTPCDAEACSGFALQPAGGRCWEHAGDAEVGLALAFLKQTRELDARGVRVSPQLLGLFLAAVTDERGDGRPRFNRVRLDSARFQGPAAFALTIFAGPVSMGDVTFEQGADFEDASFLEGASFDRAHVQGSLRFVESRLTGPLTFRAATIAGPTFFMRAQFEGDANFAGTVFRGRVRLDTASFAAVDFGGALFAQAVGLDEGHCRGVASFSGALFYGPASFREAGFSKGCDFSHASFVSSAGFTGAYFGGLTMFQDALFADSASFSGATFRDTVGGFMSRGEDQWFSGACFDRARFQGDRTSFRGATFDSWALEGAAFRGSVADLADVHVRLDADLTDIKFVGATHLGPLLVGGRLVMNDGTFDSKVQVEVAASCFQARRARFPAGARLRVRLADVDLSEADLSAPCTLDGVGPFPQLREEMVTASRMRGSNARPRLLSVRGTDVAGLVVNDMDLAPCEFAGAHNLDELRLGNSSFVSTPGLWRWSSRQALAEEHHWRASRPDARKRFGWDPPMTRQQFELLPRGVPPGGLLPAAQIADIYRSLRKGREDDRDGPGAADFYYGEMEMRRNSQREVAAQVHPQGGRGAAIRARTEQYILSAYWLSSGYGLRAWRALGLLAVAVLMGGTLFAFVGFAEAPPTQRFQPAGVSDAGELMYEPAKRQPPRGVDMLDEGVLFAAQATTSLLRGPERPLTAPGEWLHLALRLLGPVLIALAVLALRNRAKR